MVDAFSLKFQRNNQQNALAIGFAKGKTGEKGRIFTILWNETTAYYDRAFFLREIDKRDSIRSNVFEEGGMGFGEGREKLFFRKVFPPFPNVYPSSPTLSPAPTKRRSSLQRASTPPFSTSLP